MSVCAKGEVLKARPRGKAYEALLELVQCEASDLTIVVTSATIMNQRSSIDG